MEEISFKMTTVERIQEYFHKLSERRAVMEREDACFLMVQARHLVEESDNPEEYRSVRFYGDWVVHPELIRSKVCLETLKDITRALADNWNPTSPDVTTQVSRIIGIPTLRKELMTLFQKNKLPLQLFEYFKNWQGFIGFLTWLLMNKPIGFAKDLPKWALDIRDEMIAMQKPANYWVERLMIVNIQDRPHWLLKLNGEKQLTMVGLLDLGEQPQVFRSP